MMRNSPKRRRHDDRDTASKEHNQEAISFGQRRRQGSQREPIPITFNVSDQLRRRSYTCEQEYKEAGSSEQGCSARITDDSEYGIN